MKTFAQLTSHEQDNAIKFCTDRLLDDITTERIKFDGDLGEGIREAGEKAEQMKTPWFWAEYIMETWGEDIERLARAQTAEGLYCEDYEDVIPLSEIQQSWKHLPRPSGSVNSKPK